MDPSTIVSRIRQMDGLSRADLALLAGISPSTVGRIESGKLDPTWSTLMKVLTATGMELTGKTIVSAGDASAIAAARAVLEGRASDMVSPWLDVWRRAGWVKVALDPADVLSLAIAAGNAAKFARRARKPLWAAVPSQRQWQDLPRALSSAGVEYAISGLVATDPDRVTAQAASPIVYLRNPSAVADELGLVETSPLQGTMLVATSGEELEGAETEGGLRFVTRAQAMLDAFASGGRQPDKAEAVALSWQPSKTVAA